MKTFETKVIVLGDLDLMSKNPHECADRIKSEMNDEGSRGWEYKSTIGIKTTYLVFQRELNVDSTTR